MENDHGRIQINLKQLLDQSDLSKNKLSHRAEMQWRQISSYYNDSITRLDTDVLARLCNVFQCRIEDLLTYIPPRKDK